MIKKNITIAMSTLLLICSGCSKTEDLQSDPNRVTEVTPELLLTNIEIEAFSTISLSAALASRQLSYTNGVNSNQYYNWQRSGFGTYDNLKQVSKMVEASAANETEVYQLLGSFFNSYFIVSLTETFGDVPYSEAIQADANNFTPKYDTQKSIYLKVLNDLKATSDALASNEEQLLGDVIYGGNILQWRKLINSYYLRVLMNLSHKEADTDLQLKSRFNEVFSNPGKYPIFESNADNAALLYHNIQGNRYPLQNDNDLQTAYFMEKSFVERLQELEDPRLFAFAEVKPTSSGNDPMDFSSYGGLYGSGDLNQNTSEAVEGEASRVDPRYFTDPVNEPSLLMGYSELEFILAEASVRSWIESDADIHYKNGIRASMDFYGISEVDEYLANPLIQLGSSNQIEMIMTQKHISMFLNTGWQAFYEQRRTGFPEFNTDGAGALNSGKIPKRWMYPANEAVNNGDHLTEAINRQFPSGDNINSIMWILK